MSDPSWMPAAICSLIAVAVLAGGSAMLDVWRRRVGQGIRENVRNLAIGLLLALSGLAGVSYWLVVREESRREIQRTREALKAVEREREDERQRVIANESLRNMERHNAEVAAKERKELDAMINQANDRLNQLAEENQRRIDELRRGVRGR